MFALALTVVLGLVSTSAQAAKGAKPPKGNKDGAANVVGTVLSVAGTNLTVQTKGKTSAEVTIATGAATKFQINGNNATLADIKPGMIVVATPATGTAENIIVTTGNGGKKPKGKPKAK